MVISFGGLGNRRSLAPIKYSKNLDDEFLKASRNIDIIDLEVKFKPNGCIGVKEGGHKLNDIFSVLAHAKLIEPNPDSERIVDITNVVNKMASDTDNLPRDIVGAELLALQELYRMLRRKSIESSKLGKRIRIPSNTNCLVCGDYSYTELLSDLADELCFIYKKQAYLKLGDYPNLLRS